MIIKKSEQAAHFDVFANPKIGSKNIHTKQNLI